MLKVQKGVWDGDGSRRSEDHLFYVGKRGG